ncbi:MAG: Ig domain protein group 1 domain protein, partial [Nocardioides sp.]|nr:Ig domain protein group 1 domain protein [Nocardioides sp.]
MTPGVSTTRVIQNDRSAREHRGVLVRLLTSVVLLLTLAIAPARAADPSTLTLTTTGGYADTTVPLTVTLASSDGTPVAGASVLVERRVEGAWRPLTTVVTDEAGQATTSAPRRARTSGDNVFRATYAGDETHDPATATATSRLVRRGGVVTVGGPTKVVDERTTTVRVVSRTADGTPVSGVVRVERSVSGGPWRRARTVGTDARGRASFVVRPRTDTRWRAVTRAQDWVTGDRSPVHRIDNLPPGTPVRLPAAAPRPRVGVPPQARATGR